MAARKLLQFKGRLTPAQVAQGINIASDNARSLAGDAKLLMEHGRLARAASLAILSIEESGKAAILRHLCVASSPEEATSCWREYRSHRTKNVMGGLLQEVARGARKLDDFIGLFREDAEYPQLLDQVKQLGFYTDCLGIDAHWSAPSEVIEESLAKQLVATAELLAKADAVPEKEIELWIRHLGPVWNKHPGLMREALQDWYEDMQKHGLAAAGPNEMRRFIEEGVVATWNH